MQDGLPGSVKRLRQFGYGYRLRVGDYRVLFDLAGRNLLSKPFVTDAMPTLLNPAAKSAKASTNRRPVKRAVRKPVDGGSFSVSRMISRVSAMIEEMEELRDQLALEEARQANTGKPTTTVNELRRKRGLQEL
jgi:hypothetical protein